MDWTASNSSVYRVTERRRRSSGRQIGINLLGSQREEVVKEELDDIVRKASGESPVAYV